MPEPNISDAVHKSGLLGIAVTFGNLAVWIGLFFTVLAVIFFWRAMLRTMRLHPEGSGAAGAGTAGSVSALAANGGGKNGDGKQANGKNGNGNGKHARPAAHSSSAASKAASTATSSSLSEAEQKTEVVFHWAKQFWIVSCSMMFLAALCLWTLLLTQQYNISYVLKNTNPEIPIFYRFAAFWANQEGTFILWGMYNAVIAGFLFWRAKQDVRWVMPFFALINVSLFTLLFFMNPFWFPAAEEVRKGLTAAGLPPDKLAWLPNTWSQHLAYYFGWGTYIRPNLLQPRGLNESLQNFWFVIHPPTLFVGYSTMMVPGIFALGALMRRDYDQWINRAASWLMFSWTVLAFGVFLGAYWAYETLGWGGYWSWDPVENSSLIPWLVGTTLLHGLLAQRNRGNFKHVNLFLGMLALNSVWIASFLVRSGVLSEVSVHSFATPDKAVFFTLLVGMIAMAALSLGIWLWRFKDIQSEIAYEHVWERHFGFFLGLITLSAISVVVTFGVTMPIWKPWISGGQKSTLDHLFYNKATLPIVYVTVLLMALTPLMPWRHAREQARPPKLFTKVALALAGIISAYFMVGAIMAWQNGFRSFNDTPPSFGNDHAYIAFALLLGLSLITNFSVLIRAFKGGILNTGAWWAHIGFILMLAGVMMSTRLKTVQNITELPLNSAVKLYGRDWTFKGERPSSGDGDRPRMLVQMREPGGHVRDFDPKVFINTQGEKPTAMAWPQMESQWFGGAWGDLYLEPSSMVSYKPLGSVEKLKKDSPPQTFLVQHPSSQKEDTITVQFLSLDTSELQKAVQAGARGPMLAYADLTVTVNGEQRSLRAPMELQFGGPEGPKTDARPIVLEGPNAEITYTLFCQTNMTPGNLVASVVVAVPVANFQVMHIPGIQVLWFGVYIMVGGGIIAFLRRRQLANKIVPAFKGPRRTDEPEPTEKAPLPERELVGAE